MIKINKEKQANYLDKLLSLKLISGKIRSKIQEETGTFLTLEQTDFVQAVDSMTKGFWLMLPTGEALKKDMDGVLFKPTIKKIKENVKSLNEADYKNMFYFLSKYIDPIYLHPDCLSQEVGGASDQFNLKDLDKNKMLELMTLTFSLADLKFPFPVLRVAGGKKVGEKIVLFESGDKKLNGQNIESGEFLKVDSYSISSQAELDKYNSLMKTKKDTSLGSLSHYGRGDDPVTMYVISKEMEEKSEVNNEALPMYHEIDHDTDTKKVLSEVDKVLKGFETSFEDYLKRNPPGKGKKDSRIQNIEKLLKETTGIRDILYRQERGSAKEKIENVREIIEAFEDIFRRIRVGEAVGRSMMPAFLKEVIAASQTYKPMMDNVHEGIKAILKILEGVDKTQTIKNK